jgi:hypothetical protein
MAASFGRCAAARNDVGEWRTHFGTAAATILYQEKQQIPHRLIVDRIDDGAALALGSNQSGVRQNEELGRHRVGRNRKLAGDIACRHALRPGLYEQTEDFKARFLRNGRKTFDGGLNIHISLIPEMMY